MADPFQNVDAAGPEFIKLFADSMDQRQADPTMERIVAAYLGHLNVTDASTVVEVGAGAGADVALIYLLPVLTLHLVGGRAVGRAVGQGDLRRKGRCIEGVIL